MVAPVQLQTIYNRVNCGHGRNSNHSVEDLLLIKGVCTHNLQAIHPKNNNEHKLENVICSSKSWLYIGQVKLTPSLTIVTKIK